LANEVNHNRRERGFHGIARGKVFIPSFRLRRFARKYCRIQKGFMVCDPQGHAMQLIEKSSKISA
jgi:hypothetical protein